MAINTNYNRPFYIHPKSYIGGYIVGACRSDKNRIEKVEIDATTWGTIIIPSIERVKKTRIERYGEYLFLIVEVNEETNPEPYSRSLSQCMRYTAESLRYVKARETQFLKDFSKEKFCNPVEEKDYLQQTLVVGGYELVYHVADNLGDDMLALAFIKAADIGRIPTAREIFAMRDKLTGRLNR